MSNAWRFAMYDYRINKPGGRFLLSLLAFMCLLACGKKDWPTVQDQEDVFTWATVSAQRESGCLNIAARLGGAADNLAAVVLELEGRPETCLSCPFQPSSRTFIELRAPQITQQGPRVWISHCGLDAEMAYRCRLRGKNRITGLEDSLSKVISPSGQ